MVFAVGFALGVLRQLVVIPRFGTDAGFLVELPLMLAAIFFSARFVVRRFSIARDAGPRLAMGAVAVALLFVAESALAWAMGGPSYLELVSRYALIPALVSALLPLALLLMPWIFAHRMKA